MSPLCFHVSTSMSLFPEFCEQKTELTENGNCRLFAANGNGKLSFLAANGNRKLKFVILGRQTINGNRRLLFQQ
jgi:hypothetical protein